MSPPTNSCRSSVCVNQNGSKGWAEPSNVVEGNLSVKGIECIARID